MHIDKDAIYQAALETATAEYARTRWINETEENLQFLANSRARVEHLRDELGPDRYEQMKASLENARVELEELLEKLKSS